VELKGNVAAALAAAAAAGSAGSAGSGSKNGVSCCISACLAIFLAARAALLLLAPASKMKMAVAGQLPPYAQPLHAAGVHAVYGVLYGVLHAGGEG
jgi:hypothetical protein